MIETIASWILKLIGMGYLRPFVKGLIHIGRPSDVQFPKELMGQGLSLVLSGLNNTMAFQSNPDWVWPAWFERQKDPENPGFIPTGMNLMTSNLTHRNWTSIGVEGEKIESMVDEVGMVVAGPYSWSVFPYIRTDFDLYLPTKMTPKQIKQYWEDGVTLCTEYQSITGLQWIQKVTPLKSKNEQLVTIENVLINSSIEPMTFHFGLTLRPYNTLSISHINRIKYKGNLWRINRQAALWMLQDPDRVRVADRNGPDPLYAPERVPLLESLTSKSGIACGLAEYDLDIPPNTERCFTQVMTIRVLTRKPIHYFSKPDLVRIQAGVDEEKRQWEARNRTGSRIQIPEPRWQEAWDSIRNRYHVFDDGTHFSPGTYLYHQFWLRDHAFLSLAAMTLGDQGTQVRMRKSILATQRPDGMFLTQDGEWDSNGQAIFCLANSVFSAGDPIALEAMWPKIYKAVQWINRQRQSTREFPSRHFGLLPAGFSAEHFGPNDHYYWDNFWSIKGLKDAAWIASVLGLQDEKKMVEDSLYEYQNDLDRSISMSLDRTGGLGLPSSPYRKFDASAIGGLVALSPLGVKPMSTPWILQTADTLWKQCVHQGMFFQSIIHTGLNAYLSLQLARVFLMHGDKRWRMIIDSVLDHASQTWTWPEAIHPQTRGGCMGDGDHGWAAAEFLSVLSMILVRVQDEELILAGNLPAEWYIADMDIRAEQIVTRHGIVSWRIQGLGEHAEFTWNIQRNRSQKAIPTFVGLPVPLGLNNPFLSAFDQGRRKIRLQQDQGSLTFPIQEARYRAY